MKTEGIVSAICTAVGAVCGGGAGNGLSFNLKSTVKEQKLLSGGIYELRGVISSSDSDRKTALDTLDTAVTALCELTGSGIYKISAPSPAVVCYDGGFRFEREIIIIAGEE